ncbi:STY4528 family pathogenicity island replication protein [Pasteurella multocida]
MELRQIIKQQTEVARKKLSEKHTQINADENTPFQGLLFVGNRHETVPFRLLTDKYLTPRAKTAWQMIKLNAQQFQGAVFPSYDELSHWLSDRAFQNKALSRKTISQTLLLLRLTRWLTLCETVRNAHGQVLGNVYVMNDEPLSMMDCLQLNEDYLRLLEKSVKHSDPLIRDVAAAIICEILEQKSLFHFVSHLDVIRERYQQLKDGFKVPQAIMPLNANLAEAVEITQEKLLSSNMELSQENRELSQKIDKSLSSNMELSPEKDAKSLILGSVPKWNSVDSQYSTSTNNIKYSTGTDLSEDVSKQLGNLSLTRLELDTVHRALTDLTPEMREAVLFEAQQRIAEGNVKKPLGYLMSLIRRAKSGEFKPYLITKSVQTQTQPVKVSGARHVLPSTPVVSPKLTQSPTKMIEKLAASIRR